MERTRESGCMLEPGLGSTDMGPRGAFCCRDGIPPPPPPPALAELVGGRALAACDCVVRNESERVQRIPTFDKYFKMRDVSHTREHPKRR